MKRRNYTGEVFGRLLVVSEIEEWTGKQRRVICKCACGKFLTVIASNLTQGHTKSCGCLQRELAAELMTTHGLSQHPLYDRWHTMIERCHNPKNSNYPNYGGRGITVCLEWQMSFQRFLADMGEAPTSQHTIERKNNNGNYEPSNCIWATRIEQSTNKRPYGSANNLSE